MGSAELENFRDILVGTLDHDVFQLIAKDSRWMAQVIDFIECEDQIEFQYPISKFSSEPAKELV